MGKKSPKPPPAPDYAAAAQAQGQANLDAARLTARISNPNVVTPYGSQTVTFGRSVFDEAGYNKAMADYQKQLADYESRRAAAGPPGDVDTGDFGVIDGGGLFGGYRGGNVLLGRDPMSYGAAPVAPTREQFTTKTDLDTPFIEQKLSPEQQRILEAQQRVELGLAGLGETGLGVAQDVLGKRFQPNLRDLQTELSGYGAVQGAPDLMGMGRARADVMAGELPTFALEGRARADVGAPTLQQGVGPLSQQTGLNLGGVQGVQYAPNLGIFGLASGRVPTERLQRGIDTQGLAPMPVEAGTTGQQAILSRVLPQVREQRQMLETQLANQGIPRGSEAYNRAIREQQQQENDIIQQAALQGLQLDMSARQQGFGEAQAAAQFANQAALGQFGMGAQAAQLRNQALQQNVQTSLAQQQAQNVAQQQDFAQRVAAGEFGNAAQQALFGAGLQQGQFANQAALQQQQAALASQQAYNQSVAQNQAAALDAYRALLVGQAQGFGQQMDVQSARNAALAQNQAIAAQQQQLANAAQLQQYNQALQAGQFGNTALQQSLQQQLALRNQPLNEIAALMSGVQVNMPQFQGYSGANVAAAPIFAGTQAAGDFAQRNYANQVGAYNAKMGLLGGLAGAAGAAAGGGFFGNPFGGP